MKNIRTLAVLTLILFSITISADNLASMPADLAEEMGKDPSTFSNMLDRFKGAPPEVD